mgnify:CR=1 FL=1
MRVQNNLLHITPCLLTDSYKLGHFQMMMDELTNVHSYFESRNGALFSHSMFYSLQMQLKRFFMGKVITWEDIKLAEEFNTQHFFGVSRFNTEMWEHIMRKHEGRLPLRIRAVPEGAVIPVNNPLMSVEVTDEDQGFCKALTNHFETILTHIWHPSNVGTISFFIKQKLRKYFEETSDDMGALDFMLHDFGFRGATCVESAGMGGSGHLVNFKGTDTVPAILFGRHYYNTDEMLGYSVLASEHCIKTQKGKAGEMELVKELIRKLPNGIFSDVQDSYDIEYAINYIGTHFKSEIMMRKGKYVFRPDSPRFKGDTPADQVLWIAERLGHYFGYTINSKGYKVLNPKVGIIYSDGLSMDQIFEIAEALKVAGWAAETCVYGMGGGLLQKHNRDTQRNAFKASAQKQNDIWVDVSKDPLDKTKASKKGKVESFVDDNGKVFTELMGYKKGFGLFDTVFEDGDLLIDWNFQQVRKNAEIVYE